jgi:hypothetical protein
MLAGVLIDILFANMRSTGTMKISARTKARIDQTNFFKL